MEAWYARAPVWMLLSAAPEALPYLLRQFFPAGRREEFINAVRSADDPAAWFRQFFLFEFCMNLVASDVELDAAGMEHSYVFACELLTGRAVVVTPRGGVFARRSVLWSMDGSACGPYITYAASEAPYRQCGGDCRKPPRGWRRIVEALWRAYPHLFVFK